MRLEIVDFFRGIFLIAMTIFHFVFDLQLFGLVDSGFVSQPYWKYFARVTAASFLFLVGFNLVLAHTNRINWFPLGIRLAKIATAALSVTVVTLVFTPEQFIYFGILHHIAFASIVCLCFLKANIYHLIIMAVFTLILPVCFKSHIFDFSFLTWIGLSRVIQPSSDFVPVLPWISAVFTGMFCARLCFKKNLLQHLNDLKISDTYAGWIKFMGRHSLIYYLVHQPILIVVIYFFTNLSGLA